MRQFSCPRLFPNICILLLCGVLYSQELGQLSGKVVDSKTEEPLVGVNILIQNTFIGTTTDNNGRFYLFKLKPGHYNLIVSMIGYRKEIVKNITIDAGGKQALDIKLEQDVMAFQQVVVTASRMEQDIMESPLSVAVVGTRQIQEKAAISLIDVLPYEAGVTTVKDQLNIRGASGYTMRVGSRSLLLLDGVPLLGSAAGNITWSVIPTSEIARVEIVKSGGSALYGSSAMGGVLNIITRNAPASPETRVRIKMGRYSEPKYDQWKWRNRHDLFYTTEFTFARPFGEHSGWFRVQKNYSDGYTQLNWGKSYNFTGKIKFNFGTQYSASLYANYLMDKNGLESQWKSPADPFEAPAGSENDYGEGNKFNLNGFFNYVYSPDVVMKVKGALYDVHWQNHGSNTDFSNERKHFGEYQIATNWTKTLNTTAGVVLEYATINARIFGNHHSFSSAAYLLAQQRFRHGFILSAGGRWENYQVDGNTLDQTIAPQLALNWNNYQWLSLRASVGNGFRVPTIAELFSKSQLNIFKVEPNPDLEAETSVSYEVGSTVMLMRKGWFTHLKIDASLFRTDFKNLIEPLPDELGVIHFENITNARITGAELSLVSALLDNRLLLNTAYTWLDPVEVNAMGSVIDTLSYRQRHNIITTVTTHWRGISTTVEYRYASRMEKTELFNENPLTDQDRRVPIHLWNASISYSWNNWDFLVRVENIFQYYYVELERNMGEERNISLTIARVF